MAGRKKLMCPCGTCRWCFRCNTWITDGHMCLHLSYLREPAVAPKLIERLRAAIDAMPTAVQD